MTFCETFGISIPIIQAPMAGVSTPALAAAVSEAGALGSLGLGAMNATAACATILDTKALTGRPFNVNVFCHQPPVMNAEVDATWLKALTPFFERFGAKTPAQLHEIYTSFNQDAEMLAMLLTERPTVVSFHFGLPPQGVIEALRQAGILLIASATHLEEARMIADAGLDAVIAQGIEAGGHRGVFEPDAADEALSSLTLTRQLVVELNIPVITAGGLMNGAGISAALALGAQAAQLGTAFIACQESAADDAYRNALLGNQPKHTVLTRAISGRLARGFPNPLTELGKRSDCPTIPSYPLAYDAAKSLHTIAKAAGISDFATQWAGEGASLSRALPAADLIRLLHAEMMA